MLSTDDLPADLGDAFTLPDPATDPERTATTEDLWKAVDQHQQTLERLLHVHLGGFEPQVWATMLDAVQALEGWHEQSRVEVRQLLARAPGNAPVLTTPAPYRLASLSGALAEARVQRHLGTLTLTDYTAIEQCLEALLEHGEPPQPYQFARLKLTDDEDHQDTWKGAVVIETLPLNAEEPHPLPVLMYRFGVQGGWSSHPNREALLSVAAAALGALPSQRVSLEPALASAFDEALNQGVSALDELLAGEPLGDEAHERLALEALDELTVPVNPSRLLALARVEETRRSLRLGEQAQPWLSRLPEQIRAQLARLITDYAAAIVRRESLLRRDLPAPQAYAAAQVSEYLSTRFNLTQPCRIQVQLPRTVSMVKELISGSGAPGTPTRLVPRPSAETELMPLETLALTQIDDDLDQRLAFLQVHVSPASHPQQDALIAAIDNLWLREVLPELNVAGKYERLLADVHLRAGQFQTPEDEANLLARPFALMLEMHWIMARHQGRLDARGAQMAERACHATTADAWRTEDMTLRLRPAALTLFDERTHSGGSTLAGVTFIEDSVSGTTLLYLPQAPDGRAFSQYENLAAAVEALAGLFVNDRMRRYLCGRAIEGDPQRLESLVNQALIRGYRSLVSARGPWPAHHSLTHNQHLAELGLAVSAHRALYTSNADRVFDQALRSRGQAVGYIRMALGFVPFLGSAIALVDAVAAGIDAGNAFASGDTLGGLEATESVLLSIVDALFDFGPGALASTPAPGSLAATAKARQLRHGLEGAGRLRQLAGWSARRADEAFIGYESTRRLTSAPGTEGRWRQVYREAEGQFITRGSHVYAVEWDASLNTWRLAATRTRTYRQPIALDEAGRWQTHGHLYGSLVEGGLRGGGGVQSYLADRLDPLWPDALRRLLPRWWTDAHFRRQQQLASEQSTQARTLIEHDKAVPRALEAWRRGEAPLEPLLESIERVIQDAERYYETLQRYRELTRGRRFNEAGLDQSRAAATLCSRAQIQIKLSFIEAERLHELARTQRAQLHELVQTIPDDLMPGDPIVQVITEQAASLRKLIVDKLTHYDRIEQDLDRLRTWERRITSAEHRRRLHPETEKIYRSFPEEPFTFLRLGILIDVAIIDDLTQPSWLYMRRLYGPARARFDRVAIASYTGDRLSLPPQQQQRLKTQLRESSQAFIRVLQRLLVSYPDQFDRPMAERLINELRKLRDGLPAPVVERPRAPGQPRPRVFEADGLLLVGQPLPGEPDVLVLPSVNNRQERWTRNAQRQWVPEEPPLPAPRPRPLAEQVRHAQGRLDELPDFRQRLQQYAQQRMLPADLEDLYLGEAQELEYRLQQLREADRGDNHEALIDRLQQQADRLREEGRLARIAQCKASTKPTAGYLEYLLGEDEVLIRRLGTLKPVGTPGQRSLLQEYEVFDAQSGEAWAYAHFHYAHENPHFADFTVAHLKTPDQRYLRTAAPGEEPVWRGEISRRLAAQLFEPLFR